MKHLDKFNEHVYNKAAVEQSKKLPENRSKVIQHLIGQIEQRQLSNFRKSGDIISFNINGRKYKIDQGKLCLYRNEKGEEKEVEIELTSTQLSTIMSALKKPLKSPKAGDSTKKHPEENHI